MKLVSLSKIMMTGALALVMACGTAMAHGAHSDSKKVSKYPNADRTAPHLDLVKQSDSDNINKGATAYNNNDYATAQKVLAPYADGTATKSKYAQVVALQILGNIAFKNGDLTQAIQMLEKALTLKVMPNDLYFDLQYELAQFYQANKQYQKSLDTVAAWRAKGKLETANSYGLEGVDYYRLGQYKDSIAAIKKAKSLTDQPNPVWDQVLAADYAESGDTSDAVAAAKAQLAKNPNDMTTLNNAVQLLIGAGKYSDALDMMESAHAKGLLKAEKDYILLAKLHMMKAQESDKPKPEAAAARAVLKEGIGKGIIKPDYQSYRVYGDSYYLSDDLKSAIASYEKGAKTAPDGEMDLLAARLLSSQGKNTAAKAHARTALKRGVKHPGRAYVVIARAEQAAHNKRAAMDAMRKAEKDPTTRSQARAWLKKASR